MPGEKKIEGKRVERFPTIDVLLRNMQEGVDISSRFLEFHKDEIAEYETFAIESGKRENIDDAAKYLQVLKDLEELTREVEDAAKALRIMRNEVSNPDQLQGAIRGAMSSYKKLQEKLHEAETLIAPTTL